MTFSELIKRKGYDTQLEISVDTTMGPQDPASEATGMNNRVLKHSFRDSIIAEGALYDPDTRLKRVKKWFCTLMDSIHLQIFTLVLIFFSLFAVNAVHACNAPNSVDPYINAVLILCLVVFTAEIVITILCRPKPPWFLLSLDVIATATIVLDLSWVAASIGFDEGSSSTATKAAIISARLARIIRLVRLLRLLRIITYLSSLAKRVLANHKAAEAAKGSGGGSPSNIGGKLTDAMVIQLALVTIITVIFTALITSWNVEVSPFEAFVAEFDAQYNDTAAQLQPQVDVMLQFSKDTIENLKPLTLRVGNSTWSWLAENGGYPPRESDTIHFEKTDDRTYLEVDASALNRKDAILDILLTIFVLLILISSVVSVNVIIYKTLVRPLERIFNTIRTKAAQIMTAAGESLADTAPSNEEDGDIAQIETAVNKMAKIVSHFTATGGQGTNIARSMLANYRADNDTKEWLATMVGDSVIGPSDQAPQPETSQKPADTPSGTTGNFVRKTGFAGSTVRQRNLRASVVTAVGNIQRTVTNAAAAATAGVNGIKSKVQDEQSKGGVKEVDLEAGDQQDGSSAVRRGSESSISSSTTSNIPNSRTQTGSFGIVPASQSYPDMESMLLPSLATVPNFGEGLSESQKDALLAVDLQSLKAFGFDSLDVPKEDITAHLVSMFLDLRLVYFNAPGQPPQQPSKQEPPYCDGYLDVPRLWRFIDEVALFYRDVPYHNFFHCADVTQCTYVLLDRLSAAGHLTRLEKFSLMIAALSHDMDHPGLNNMYLINNRAPLALTYNDSAVLENSHVANLYALIAKKPDIDIFSQLDPATWKEVRKIIIGAVLHTDMTQHFPMISKLEVFHEMHAAAIQAAHKAQRQALRTFMPSDIGGGSGAPGAADKPWSATPQAGYSPSVAVTIPNLFTTPDERQMLLNVILHCADISNPGRPGSIAEKWADRVLGEFFAQGDKERLAGQPISPMCDRNTTSKGASQVNFIEFVVAPLFSMVVKIFPDAGELMENVLGNRKMWQEVLLSELTSPSPSSPVKSDADKAADITKAESRLATFVTKYNEALTLAAKRRRDHMRRISSFQESARSSTHVARSTGQGSNVGGRLSLAGSEPGLLSGERRMSSSSAPGGVSGGGNNNTATVGSPSSPTAGGGLSSPQSMRSRIRSASGRMSFTVVNRIIPMDGERVTEEESGSEASAPV